MKSIKQVYYKINNWVALKISPIRAMKLGVVFYPPNYIFYDSFSSESVIVDVGLGSKAEFSEYLIKKYGLKAYGVDPTKKHERALKELEAETNGKFTHLPMAVSSQNGFVEFHESCENESGSIRADHVNVRKDKTRSYQVKSVQLKELVRETGYEKIDFLKLDLEGAEYDLLQGVEKDDLCIFGQIFIEFHHHCTAHTENDTLDIVTLISSKGFKSVTLDQHQYLFSKS